MPLPSLERFLIPGYRATIDLDLWRVRGERVDSDRSDSPSRGSRPWKVPDTKDIVRTLPSWDPMVVSKRITLGKELREFDEISGKAGFSSRSDAVRDAMHRYVSSNNWANRAEGRAVCAVSIIYSDRKKLKVHEIIHDDSTSFGPPSIPTWIHDAWSRWCSRARWKRSRA